MIKGVFFFNRGLTIAVLKSGGTGSEAGEVLMMLVTVARISWFSCSSFVGMGTRSHNLGAVVWRIFKTNCLFCDWLNVCSNFPE